MFLETVLYMYLYKIHSAWTRDKICILIRFRVKIIGHYNSHDYGSYLFLVPSFPKIEEW